MEGNLGRTPGITFATSLAVAGPGGDCRGVRGGVVVSGGAVPAPRKETKSGALEVVAPFRLNQLKLQPQPPFDFGGKPCLVIMAPDGKPRAFNAVCTHLDCTVEFHADRGELFCNCHNGVYDLNGRNVSGPPPRPLEKYNVTLRPDKDKPGQEEIIVSRST